MNVRASQPIPEGRSPHSQSVRHRYHTFRRLVEMTNEERDRLMEAGIMPALEDLEGWEFKGCNAFATSRLLGIRKFKKGFFRGASTQPHELYGYNTPVAQNGTFDPHMALPNELTPKKFGYYLVTPERQPGPDDLYPHALLLDYGRGVGNPPWEPSRVLRDYIVQVDPENHDLFLGKAYLALGRRRVFAGHFVLERYNQIGL